MDAARRKLCFALRGGRWERGITVHRRRQFVIFPNLQAHMPAWGAPVRVTRAAADGAELEGGHRPRRQAIHRHGARIGKEPGALKRTRRAARADGGGAAFVAFGIGTGFDLHQELAAVAIVDGKDGRLIQWHARAVGAHGLEAAGKQRGEVVAAVLRAHNLATAPPFCSLFLAHLRQQTTLRRRGRWVGSNA